MPSASRGPDGAGQEQQVSMRQPCRGHWNSAPVELLLDAHPPTQVRQCAPGPPTTRHLTGPCPSLALQAFGVRHVWRLGPWGECSGRVDRLCVSDADVGLFLFRPSGSTTAIQPVNTNHSAAETVGASLLHESLVSKRFISPPYGILI